MVQDQVIKYVLREGIEVALLQPQRLPTKDEGPAPALGADVLSVGGLERDVLFRGPERLERS